MMHLTNAFSLNMLPADLGRGTLAYRRLTAVEALLTIKESMKHRTWAGNAIGHKSTDEIVRKLLFATYESEHAAGRKAWFVVYNDGEQKDVSLLPGDSALVAQYVGPQLPEGATTLPEGARIDFVLMRNALTGKVGDGCLTPAVGEKVGEFVVVEVTPGTDSVPAEVVYERLPG